MSGALNTDHDQLTAGLRAAEADLDEADLDTAQETPRVIPTRLPLGQVNPGQQVLDVQTKLITHAIRIAAFNTATTLARAVRIHTSYARANDEAHTLIRQALTGSGDIDPRDGVLTVRLDPLPTRRATTAIAELCEHLTATQTRYPGDQPHPALRDQDPALPTQIMTPYPEPWERAAHSVDQQQRIALALNPHGDPKPGQAGQTRVDQDRSF
jgi:hypothetical protein